MKNSSKKLKYALLSGAIYFFMMFLAHITGFKVPGLFIYFDVPSYPYQDGIISALVLGWSMFFYTASRDPLKNLNLIRTILFAGGGAIAVLSFVNLQTDFASLNVNTNVFILWMELLLLLIYLLVVLFFYIGTVKEIEIK